MAWTGHRPSGYNRILMSSELPKRERVETLTRELFRRRQLQPGTETYQYRTSLAEALVLDHYGRLPTLEDLKVQGRSLQVVMPDDHDHQVRVVWALRPFWRVYARQLDAHVFVFVRITDDEEVGELVGWLPVDEVEQAPVHWVDKYGRRSDYAHEVQSPFFLPIPGTFSFVDYCGHDAYPAAWDYTHDGWECLGCRRFLYDADERENSRNDRYFFPLRGIRNQDASQEAGDEC